MRKIIANENRLDLFYALSKASLNSDRNDKFCWFMSYKDYERVKAFIVGFATHDMLEDEKELLFGYPVKIRDELKHIYLGIEMDEANDD